MNNRLSYQSGGLGCRSFLCLSVLCVSLSAYGASNIDPDGAGNRYGWSTNTGWVDMKGDVANGVVVTSTCLSGFAWSPNVGWISFGAGPADGVHYANDSADDFGVNKDATGRLWGYAWGANVGWICLETAGANGASVCISPYTGLFDGYAWSPNCGWISFTGLPAYVARTTPWDTLPANPGSVVRFERNY